MGHRENHGVLWEAFGQEHSGPQFVIKIGTAQALELVRPQVDSNTFGSIDSAKVRTQHARSYEAKPRSHIAGESFQLGVIFRAKHVP